MTLLKFFASECVELPVKWLEGKLVKSFMQSDDENVFKLQFPGEENEAGKIVPPYVKKDYNGFLMLSRKNCGADFLEGFADGRLSFEILDKRVFYEAQYSYHRDDASKSSLTLQFR